MSALPTINLLYDNRDIDGVMRASPLVVMSGDETAVLGYLPVFRAHYNRFVRQAALGIVGQLTKNIDIDENAWMRIVSNNGVDTVYLHATTGGDGNEYKLEGFLVTFSDSSQRVYLFDFDANSFGYSEAGGLMAGNRRVSATEDAHFSWDGTGGGDIILESETETYRPNYSAQPFGSLSGTLYFQDKEVAFVEGSIIGVGANDTALVVAESYGGAVRLHQGSIEFNEAHNNIKDIHYNGVLGTFSVPAMTVVNFNSELTQCVCGVTIVTEIPVATDSTAALNTTTISLPDRYVMLYSGFDVEDNLIYAAKKSTTSGVNTSFCPKNFIEYGLGPSNDSSPIVTTSRIGDETKYYNVTYPDTLAADSPDDTGTGTRLVQCTVLKKPVITYNAGFFPSLIYTWMRTEHMETKEEMYPFMWYMDFKTSDFVRARWIRSYIDMWTMNEYGTAPASTIDVLHTTTVNINGQTQDTATGMNRWFYTCSNGAGDFVLRKSKNGDNSPAMLVSKSGATITLDNTIRVGII